LTLGDLPYFSSHKKNNCAISAPLCSVENSARDLSIDFVTRTLFFSGTKL
jgi:hypothetical protein